MSAQTNHRLCSLNKYIQNIGTLSKYITLKAKVKFIYSEQATKFCKISTVDLTVTTEDKSTVEILQKFVAFSEYMNFINEVFCTLGMENHK